MDLFEKSVNLRRYGKNAALADHRFHEGLDSEL